MNKKIKQYSALAIASAAVIPMACKKDSNNADIDDKVLNKLISTTGTASAYFGSDSIDVNGDGVFDLEFNIGGGTYYTTAYANSYVEGLRSGNEVVTNNITFNSYTYTMITPKNSGEKIGPSSATWNYFGYLGAKYGSETTGNAGAGDKFYGFRFKAGANTHYGWIKINVASDFKSMTVKELAYHKTPNTEIEVGAK